MGAVLEEAPVASWGMRNETMRRLFEDRYERACSL